MKFHPEHTWVKPDGDTALVGITDHAQDQLGRIVFVDLPEADDELVGGQVFGQIESQKTTSDLIAPASGIVVESNLELEDKPETINDSPQGRGWITRIRLTEPDELNQLLDEVNYKKILAE